MYELLVIGDLVPDLVLTGGDVRPVFGQAEKLVSGFTLTLGGSAAITASAAARLGLETAFAGVVGDDLFGRYALSSLWRNGVDTSHCIVDPNVRTGVSVVLNEFDDRAILTYSGSIEALGSRHLVDAPIGDTQHVHVGSAFLLTGLASDINNLFERAHESDASTSLDTNWDPSLKWDVSDWLDACDVFLPNEAEALGVTGTTELESAFEILRTRVQTVAIKRGPDGAVAARDEAVASVGSPRMKQVDAVGSGDTFDAGFLYGWIHGWTLQRSLELAVICGSLAMREGGGTAAQPTLDEALSYMAPTD